MSIGHNTAAGGQLKTIVERIERLEEEKREIAEQVREVYAEAKANGYSTKVLRQVVKLRKMDVEQRQEEEALRDLYWHAINDAFDAAVALGQQYDAFEEEEEEGAGAATDMPGIIY